MKRKLTTIILALMVSALFFTGCTGNSGTPATNETPSPEPSPDSGDTDVKETAQPSDETPEPAATPDNIDEVPESTPEEGKAVLEDGPALGFVRNIKIGWNLGNTLDATANWIQNGKPEQYETAWGNPKTTKAMLDGVKKGGFNLIRIPVSWGEHVGDAPDYVIDEAWLNRVQEVVDYAIDKNTYVIINMHHEEWHFPTYENLDAAKAQLVKMWEQIAERFKDYGTNLIFEGLNEPRMKGTNLEWSGGNDEARDVINKFNAAFFETIRKAPGHNPVRYLMIPTYAASTDPKVINALVIPDDDKVIVSVHAYTPYNFALNESKTNNTWSADKASDTRDIDNLMRTLHDSFTSKGIPVILGEFGARDKNNLDSRVAWAEYYVKSAAAVGIPCIWWDNGGFTGDGELFGIYNRRNLKWEFEEIKDALMRGINQ